jgi:hypothetical protein
VGNEQVGAGFVGFIAQPLATENTVSVALHKQLLS